MSLNMNRAHDRLECAQLLFARFCEDLKTDGAKARTRLIAGIQICLESAAAHEPIDWVNDAISTYINTDASALASRRRRASRSLNR